MKRILLTLTLGAVTLIADANGQTPRNTAPEIGTTEITRWPEGKRAAMSITYDDGSINQFRIGVPIMDDLGLPGTFYINTGRIPGGSKWTGRHIGRSWREIAEEAKTVPTTADNVFERASAMRFMPFSGAGSEFTRAGIEIDADRVAEGVKIVGDFYDKVNAGEAEPVPQRHDDREPQQGELTWDLARELTARGHEFSSHMTTHPYMSALDDPNILYELETSRDEIRRQLGVRSTLVGEMPYDTEAPRAFEAALTVYPVSRSRPWFARAMELRQPHWSSLPDDEKEYRQMRQTVYTRTTLAELNGWVDTAAAGDNIWLVTIHHGIDGIGWEAQRSEDIEAHFRHVASMRDKVWVATFGDAARYVEQRLSARVTAVVDGDAIVVEVDHPLDKRLFDLPLTLRTRVDPTWREARVSQGSRSVVVKVQRDDRGPFVMYEAVPGDEKITIER